MAEAAGHGGRSQLNFVLAIIVYTGILAGWGESFYSSEDNRIYVNELSYEMGFRTGDRILGFDGYLPENFGMLQAELVRSKARKATVLRGTDTLDIYIDHNMLGTILKSPGMFDLAVPFVISGVSETSPNYGADIRPGDRMIEIDGRKVEFVQDSWETLREKAGSSVEVKLMRDLDTIGMEMKIDSTGLFGVRIMPMSVKTKEYTFLTAIPAGFNKTFSTIGGYIKDLGLVFTPSTEAYKSVGSFIAIGQIFPSTWDWYQFLNILALLSVMLGVMNLLPIPALDGGHILFTLYEIVTGRKPSDRFLYVTQIIGMLLIFGLMFLAFGNDIARLFR